MACFSRAPRAGACALPQALDFGEFMQVMELLCPGLDERSLRMAFAAVDRDRSGTVDYQEFMAGQQQVGRGRGSPPPTHTTPLPTRVPVATR